jgi:hypothetical protein
VQNIVLTQQRGCHFFNATVTAAVLNVVQPCQATRCKQSAQDVAQLPGTEGQHIAHARRLALNAIAGPRHCQLINGRDISNNTQILDILCCGLGLRLGASSRYSQ